MLPVVLTCSYEVGFPHGIRTLRSVRRKKKKKNVLCRPRSRAHRERRVRPDLRVLAAVESFTRASRKADEGTRDRQCDCALSTASTLYYARSEQNRRTMDERFAGWIICLLSIDNFHEKSTLFMTLIKNQFRIF